MASNETCVNRDSDVVRKESASRESPSSERISNKVINSIVLNNGSKRSLTEKPVIEKLLEKKHSVLSVDSCPLNLASPDAETKSVGDPVVESSKAIRKLSEALDKGSSANLKSTHYHPQFHSVRVPESRNPDEDETEFRPERPDARMPRTSPNPAA
ncbi:hypothetical protein FO519_000859 [Halicephalobus sp. NKZ332]|nr:hypothetical protein FO519_000859 [Halicephalobus sp. NKZ332]